MVERGAEGVFGEAEETAFHQRSPDGHGREQFETASGPEDVQRPGRAKGGERRLRGELL